LVSLARHGIMACARKNRRRAIASFSSAITEDGKVVAFLRLLPTNLSRKAESGQTKRNL
jgi:ABC-type tungstate transport system substrate-binding protein